jgi:hypothetical protein
MIQTDSVSYIAGLQLLFLTILGNWSCDHSPQQPIISYMDPDMYYHSYHDFSHFLVISNDISFFGYIKWTLKAVPDILYTIPIVFSFAFSGYF